MIYNFSRYLSLGYGLKITQFQSPWLSIFTQYLAQITHMFMTPFVKVFKPKSTTVVREEAVSLLW